MSSATCPQVSPASELATHFRKEGFDEQAPRSHAHSLAGLFEYHRLWRRRKKESAPATEQEAKGTTTLAPREETAAVALTWEQIPVYPGASLEEEFTITDNPQYELFERRLYKTQEAPKKVYAFYRDQMPKKGWKSFGHYEMEGLFESTWGTKDKNILCWVKTKETRLGGSTDIDIRKAEGKK